MTAPSLAEIRRPSRLAALRDAGLVGSAPEEAFDPMTELAAASVHAPVAVTAVLDGEQEFIKSCSGLVESWTGARTIPIDRSFCRLLVEPAEPVAVADARREPRLAGHPLLEDAGFASCAGVPLRWHGEVLGGLWVGDRRPREWTADELDLLDRIARGLGREIDLRLALRRARDGPDAAPRALAEAGVFRTLVEDALAGIYLVQDNRFRYANRRLAEMFGYTPHELTTSKRATSLIARGDRARVMEALRTLRGGGEAVRHGFRGLRRDGGEIHVEVHGSRTEVGGRPALIGTVLDRTEERRAEERLRCNEARFRTIVENAYDAVYLVDGAGLVRYASPAVERLLGRDPRTVARRPLDDVVHPDDAGRVRHALEETFAAPGRPYHTELRLMHRDGSTRVAEAVVEAVSGDDGVPVAIVNTHDVTEAKRTGAALRESEERYRLVSRATSDAVLEWIVDTGELRWNGAGPRMLRYTPEEAGRSITWFYERIHPEDREGVVREQEALLTGVESYWSGEYRFHRGDGRYACILHRGYVVRDARGRPLRMIGSLMDVTDRKHAEEAQRFLARASSLLDSSLDYEATLDALARLAVPTLADYCLVDLVEDDVRVRRVGRAHADHGRESMLRASEVVSLDADPERHPVVKVVRTGKATLVSDCSPAVLERIAHDAEHRAGLEALGLCSFMIVPLIAHDRALGAITLASSDSGRRYQPVDLVVAEDLARRAATAIEHARLYQEVQQAVQDREEVLGFVSHDLRNPLNTIYVAASFLLETEEERRSGNRKWLETIKLASDQMNSLIEELFQVTRMDAGAFTVEPAPHAVADVVHAARDLLEPLARAAELRFDVDEEDGLPRLCIDLDQVLRVLSNLVGNAIKFTPEGGSVALRVTGEGSPVEAVRFAVADSGPGIAQAELPHVFERYWQGRRGDRRGAGMGLAIAKGIVEAHGGRIGARNRPEGGAEFAFTLPVSGGDV
jgi:PAS domain S-box-containing protein